MMWTCRSLKRQVLSQICYNRFRMSIAMEGIRCGQKSTCLETLHNAFEENGISSDTI